MSFGFPDVLHDIQDAISDARKARIVTFAAARNDGGNEAIAFPANEDDVICISSTDYRGNKSGFNPSPVEGQRLSILGECVPGRGGAPKSGTSFATPIAASLGAVIMGYIDCHLSDKKYTQKVRTRRGMQGVLEYFSQERDGFKYIVPWRVLNHSTEQSRISHHILTALESV